MGKALGIEMAGAAGQTAATGAATLIGMALEKRNDKRQLRQQKALTAQQVDAQKELNDYNQSLQMDMWNKTNYGAQVEHLKKAGLNPGLMYGMGGGGGTTVGSGGGGSAQGGAAPPGGGEVQAAVGMGLQLQMLKAQKDVLQSQADLNKAKAEKTAGVDTVETETRIQQIIKQTDNEQLKGDLMKVETALKDLEQYEKQGTLQDRMDYIHWATEKAKHELEMTERSNYMQKATRDSVIDEIRARAVGAVLNNALTRADIKNTNADTALKGTQQEGIKSNISVNNQQIKESINRIMMGWDSLSNSQKETRLREVMTNYNIDPQRENFQLLLQGINGVMRSTAKPGDRHYYGDSYHEYKK